MKPALQKYRTTNWKTYNEALKSRGSLFIWLDPTMSWHGQPNGKRGRSKTFGDQAIQFCLSMKCVFNLPLRQAMGIDPKPSALSCTRLAGTGLQHGQPTTKGAASGHWRRPTTTGLHPLVESNGIKMLG